MVRVAGFEPTASWSRTMRATNCATPGYLILTPRDIIAAKRMNVKAWLAPAEWIAPLRRGKVCIQILEKPNVLTTASTFSPFLHSGHSVGE